jgi:putative ABC transport system permease protein
MKFIFQMAWREMRSSWRRLLFFFVSIGIGVAAIITVRSMIHNVDMGAAVEAKDFMGADIQISSDRAWTKEQLAAIDEVAAPLIKARIETVESLSMVRPTDIFHITVTPVQLKGIEPGFPFYGEFELAGGQRFDYSLLERGGALVARSLTDKLELKVGDRINIAKDSFEIRGIIEREPGGGGGVALGQKVFVEKQAVESSGAAGAPGLGRHAILLKVDDRDVQNVEDRLRAKFANETVGVTSYKDSEENISKGMTQTQDYVSLIGLIILVLGGIGISSVTRVFIEQKRKSIAILKCVGGKSRRIIVIYLVQVIGLGFAGSLLGVALARVALAALAKQLQSTLPRVITYDLQFGAVVEGTAVGVLIAVLFSALPLLRVKSVRAGMLLRDIAPSRNRLDLLRMATAIAVAGGLILLAAWQGGSLRVGLYFMAGLAVTAAVLYCVAALLITIVKRVGAFGTFAVRHAISSLYRPGNQTRVIVMAVGLGAFLVITVWSLQRNLLRELDFQREGRIPDLVLVNVQKGQEDEVIKAVGDMGGRNLKMIPILRARIVAINGEALDFSQPETRRNGKRIGRDYGVTYRSALEPGETVVQGRFWDPTPSPDPEVSISQQFSGFLGLNLGGTLTFDFQGRESQSRKITATVTSIRKTNAIRIGPDIVFRPGVLESDPQLTIATLNGPSDGPGRASFQRELVDRYPMMSVFDNVETLRRVERIMHNIAVAISFLGGLILASGGLILVGSIAMTKFQRVYEIAVMKTLGARRKTLIYIMLAEYSLMGFVAGVIGSLAGAGLSYAMSSRVLEIHFTFAPLVIVIGILATAALVTVVGATASYDALTHKPLAILRAE